MPRERCRTCGPLSRRRSRAAGAEVGHPVDRVDVGCNWTGGHRGPARLRAARHPTARGHESVFTDKGPMRRECRVDAAGSDVGARAIGVRPRWLSRLRTVTAALCCPWLGDRQRSDRNPPLTGNDHASLPDSVVEDAHIRDVKPQHLTGADRLGGRAQRLGDDLWFEVGEDGQDLLDGHAPSREGSVGTVPGRRTVPTGAWITNGYRGESARVRYWRRRWCEGRVHPRRRPDHGGRRFPAGFDEVG